MKEAGIVKADTRGRLALGTVINKERYYRVDVDEETETITLTPIAHMMSAAEYAAFNADPIGYANQITH